MEQTPEMELSKLVKDILSNARYTKEAKIMFDKYNLSIDDQKLAHALSTNDVNSFTWPNRRLENISLILLYFVVGITK